MKKQMKNEYEKSRREKTVDVIMEWCQTIKKETSTAEYIAGKLNEEQCRALYKKQPFNIDKDMKEVLCQICPLSGDACSSCRGSNTVDGIPLDEFRWHVISYLNVLETVMISWQLGIVERTVIEDQFSFLYDKGKGWDALTNMRSVAGGYPATTAFIEQLAQKRSGSGKVYNPVS